MSRNAARLTADADTNTRAARDGRWLNPRTILAVNGVVFPADDLVRALREAGLTDVPERFSIAPVHQEIPQSVLADIDAFIRVFDRVTSRELWQKAAMAAAPSIARSQRRETCFFSAWDFHIPPGRADRWQLIEFNDNGSGLVLAQLLNQLYYELSGLGSRGPIEVPEGQASFAHRIIAMIRAEAESFLGAPRPDPILILDDVESLETGRFRQELKVLRDLCVAAGWRAQIATPADIAWNGSRLLCRAEPVAFIVNRSTDFFWEREEFSPLRSAYMNESVYIAPNPFTYATRSDKRLLEWLSSPARDRELGIHADERELLDAHVPETRLLREENVDELLVSRSDWFFKPAHGFASHGLLLGNQVGHERLHRLLKKGHGYVAQRRAPKHRLETEDGVSLWADLRVWAYRGERFVISGRASRNPDRLDLSPPGGWLPTYGVAS